MSFAECAFECMMCVRSNMRACFSFGENAPRLHNLGRVKADSKEKNRKCIRVYICIPGQRLLYVRAWVYAVYSAYLAELCVQQLRPQRSGKKFQPHICLYLRACDSDFGY